MQDDDSLPMVARTRAIVASAAMAAVCACGPAVTVRTPDDSAHHIAVLRSGEPLTLIAVDGVGNIASSPRGAEVYLPPGSHSVTASFWMVGRQERDLFSIQSTSDQTVSFTAVAGRTYLACVDLSMGADKTWKLWIADVSEGHDKRGARVPTSLCHRPSMASLDVTH
jgi:hypothetical protein